MGKSRWNQMVSIPVNSLTHEELKEAIHEWAEGYEELEELLWSCYHGGLETVGCHVSQKSNYLDFRVNSASYEQLKNALSAAEAYGFSQVQLVFGGNPFSGPTWYKTHMALDCLVPEDVRNFYIKLKDALETERTEEMNYGFVLMADIADVFEEKMSSLEFVMSVRNHSEYEFRVIIRENQRNWKYFDEFFGSFGMVQSNENNAPYPMTSWYLNAFSKEEFYNTILSIIQGVCTRWTLEIPNEIMPDMGFNHKALLMQKKFGYTPEGIKKMNDWINENHPRPDGRKVNY